MTASGVVSGEIAARAFANAHAFIPARSQVPYALVRLGPGGLQATGTDLYAAGRGTAPVEPGTFTGAPSEVVVSRDALVELDRACREDRKGRGRVTVGAEGVAYAPIGEGAPTVVPPHGGETTGGVWGAVDDLLVRLERRAPVLPETICFDPGLLMRFSKVKADKNDRCADFYLSDQHEPALVKIGPDFTGCIMPINREAHAENVGADGLW